MVDTVSVGQLTTTGFAPGTIQNMRGGASGELIVQQLHGRYFNTTANKAMFSAASQAVATTTVGLATTYTGLALSNPITATVGLAINKCTLMQSVIQSTQVEAYALAVGYNATTNVTHTTPVTPVSNYFNSLTTPQAKVDSSATLPTAPVYFAFLQNTSTIAANGPGSVLDLEGSLILPPGAYIVFVTPTQASVAGLWFSFQWEEIPLTMMV